MRTTEVQQLTGATYRQLDHWTRRGWVTPSIDQGLGTGHQREWSTEDAVKVLVMVDLVDAGLSVERAAKMVSGDVVGQSVMMNHGAVRIAIDVSRLRDFLTDQRDLGWAA